MSMSSSSTGCNGATPGSPVLEDATTQTTLRRPAKKVATISQESSSSADPSSSNSSLKLSVPVNRSTEEPNTSLSTDVSGSVILLINNFHSIEVVDRVSETQLQVGENS